MTTENNMPTLKIENFKCHRKANICFSGLTVLVGANGAGKSSVVQSLLLIRETLKYKSGERLPLNNFNGQNLGSAADIIYNNDTSQRIRMKWLVEKPDKSTVIVLSMPLSDSILDVDIENKRNGLNELTRQDFHFLAADRLGATVSQPMQAYDFPSAGDKGQFCAQLLSEKFSHKIPECRLHSQDSSPYLLDQVNLYIKDIFPGVEIDATSSPEMQCAQVMIRNSVHGSFGLSTNVGFGISYLLPIIVTGLIAEKGAMMIVENPEAHLHPAAQSQVGKFLAMVAATGTRVVVETHSDHLVNGIQFYAVSHPEFLHSVVINNFSIENSERESIGKIKINKIGFSNNGDYTDWPEGFMDQSRKDLYELYQARKNNANHHNQK